MSLNYVKPTPSEFSPRFQSERYKRFYGKLDLERLEELPAFLVEEQNKNKEATRDFYILLDEQTQQALKAHNVGRHVIKGLWSSF